MRAADCVHDATEFRNDAVAGGVGDTAAMRFDRGIPEVAAMILQLGERAFLVGAHQAAVSSHIRGKNGREVTFKLAPFPNCAPRSWHKILPISARPH